MSGIVCLGRRHSGMLMSAVPIKWPPPPPSLLLFCSFSILKVDSVAYYYYCRGNARGALIERIDNFILVCTFMSDKFARLYACRCCGQVLTLDVKRNLSLTFWSKNILNSIYCQPLKKNVYKVKTKSNQQPIFQSKLFINSSIRLAGSQIVKKLNIPSLFCKLKLCKLNMPKK